ncbi:MAG: DUF4129 domain-containing protein [Okeania sp. SIO2C9]|uniref:DUF4129 domain-containing protein n=1 Tax=Okeania sp. SIO2C9 TaxID=2607791 RepID=UPI0013BF6938|nr:DUF4129 domain-containing protein [Okeania sp. SIO2C9]NEQ74267.1 DUF4129 domain-containing protein [Okeania sp. SIO2C9]
MSENSFEKDSLGWQFHKLQQKFGEWWEVQTSQTAAKLPGVDLPYWWDNPIILMIAKAMAWLLFAFLLSWVAIQIIRLLNPYIYSLRNKINLTTKIRTESQLELSVTAWLNQSQKYQEIGNYREACRCLYMAMLQGLHDRGIICDQPSRTDGEYLELIQQLSQPKPYQKLFITHQQLLFGNLEVSAAVFAECQQAYQQITDEKN